MTIEKWEHYRLETLAKATGATIHDLTGLTYGLRDLIWLRDKMRANGRPSARIKKIEDQIEKHIRYINRYAATGKKSYN